MNKKNSIAKYKIFTTPVVLFVVFILGIIFVLTPSINKLEENSNNVQKKLVEVEIEGEKVDELPKIKDKFIKVDASRAELDVLFSEDKIVDLVQEIEKIAEETGNEISISVDEGDGLVARKTKDNKDEENDKLLEGFSEGEYFKMDIETIGSYKELINFISRFKNLEYYNSLVGFYLESYEEEYKEDDRLLNTDVLRANATSPSNESVNSSKMALRSKLNFVFYLNKIVKENKSDNNGS